MDVSPLEHMGQAFVRRTNTLSKTRGMYSSKDEYPLKNMGRVFVHGRIPSQKHGKYSSTDEYTLKIVGKYSYTDEYLQQNIGKYSSGSILSRKHGASSRS